MRESVSGMDTAMAALFPCSLHQAQQLVLEASQDTGLVCVVANINTASQIIISGHKAAVERCIELARQGHGGQEQGAGRMRGEQGNNRIKRATLLDVSAAFHSPLMMHAQQGMKPLIEHLILKKPAVPIISNVTAESVDDVDQLRSLMAQHIIQPVQWQQSIRTGIATYGILNWLELGPSSVLTAFFRDVPEPCSPLSLCSSEQIINLLQQCK